MKTASSSLPDEIRGEIVMAYNAAGRPGFEPSDDLAHRTWIS